MEKSILDNKKILLVDDEPDVLAILEMEILGTAPSSTIDKATNFDNAEELLKSKEYDLVVLDIMGVRGFDLLEIAVSEKNKVVMLTGRALNPKALKKSHDMGAMAYLPKEKLREVVSFLEDALRYDHKSGWQKIMERLDDYYSKKNWVS